MLNGAGEGNRTLVSGLGSPRSTIEPHPRHTQVVAGGFNIRNGGVRTRRSPQWRTRKAAVPVRVGRRYPKDLATPVDPTVLTKRARPTHCRRGWIPRLSSVGDVLAPGWRLALPCQPRSRTHGGRRHLTSSSSERACRHLRPFWTGDHRALSRAAPRRWTAA